MKVNDAIAWVNLHHVSGTGTIICCLVLTNGHVVAGEAHCLSAENFDFNAGAKWAREDAERKVGELLAFLESGPLASLPSHS